jgi:hypothetical protein
MKREPFCEQSKTRRSSSFVKADADTNRELRPGAYSYLQACSVFSANRTSTAGECVSAKDTGLNTPDFRGLSLRVFKPLEDAIGMLNEAASKLEEGAYRVGDVELVRAANIEASRSDRDAIDKLGVNMEKGP